MSPDTAARLIEAATGFWAPEKALEITLEANPTSVEAAKLTGFAQGGVNRLSLGVQSFSDKSLKFLGREHSSSDALRAISLSRETFERSSFDLIYGLPNQSLEDWKSELNQGLDLANGHLSLYQLSIEKGTPFFRQGVPEADEDLGVDLFNLTHEITELSGYNYYEISNYAISGQACRHNLEIWRGGDYIGIGPGAHGRLSDTGGTDALYQIHDPARWLAAVIEHGHGTAKRAPLGPRERAQEVVMTGLRLQEGIDRERFHALTGQPLDRLLNREALQDLIDGGFLHADAATLRATRSGLLCLNTVLAELL